MDIKTLQSLFTGLNVCQTAVKLNKDQLNEFYFLYSIFGNPRNQTKEPTSVAYVKSNSRFLGCIDYQVSTDLEKAYKKLDLIPNRTIYVARVARETNYLGVVTTRYINTRSMQINDLSETDLSPLLNYFTGGQEENEVIED